MKRLIRKLAKKVNVLLADTSRIGVELENDLSRLTDANSIKTVFDVGANHGQSAIPFSKSYPLAQIYSFEPVSSNFSILESNCSRIKQIKLINKGLGKKSGVATIGLSNHSGGHSLLLAGSGSRTEKITIITIDEFCQGHLIDKIDLLKIDVEGFEIDVLKGADAILTKGGVRFIYAECIFEPDDGSPHTLFQDLHLHLQSYGFSFFACYHESFHLEAGSAMGNVLWVNKQLLPASATGKVKNII